MGTYTSKYTGDEIDRKLDLVVEFGKKVAGVATPSTVPAEGAELYFASAAGTYANFGNVQVHAGELVALIKQGNGSWARETVYSGDGSGVALIDTGSTYAQVEEIFNTNRFMVLFTRDADTNINYLLPLVSGNSDGADFYFGATVGTQCFRQSVSSAAGWTPLSKWTFETYYNKLEEVTSRGSSQVNDTKYPSTQALFGLLDEGFAFKGYLRPSDTLTPGLEKGFWLTSTPGEYGSVEDPIVVSAGQLVAICCTPDTSVVGYTLQGVVLYDGASSSDAIVTVQALPTASADTMGFVYRVASSGALHVTKKDGNVYSWVELVDAESSQTLTHKTIDCDSSAGNTIQHLPLESLLTPSGSGVLTDYAGQVVMATRYGVRWMNSGGYSRILSGDTAPADLLYCHRLVREESYVVHVSDITYGNNPVLYKIISSDATAAAGGLVYNGVTTAWNELDASMCSSLISLGVIKRVFVDEGYSFVYTNTINNSVIASIVSGVDVVYTWKYWHFNTVTQSDELRELDADFPVKMIPYDSTEFGLDANGKLVLRDVPLSVVHKTGANIGESLRIGSNGNVVWDKVDGEGIDTTDDLFGSEAVEEGLVCVWEQLNGNDVTRYATFGALNPSKIYTPQFAQDGVTIIRLTEVTGVSNIYVSYATEVPSMLFTLEGVGQVSTIENVALRQFYGLKDKVASVGTVAAGVDMLQVVRMPSANANWFGRSVQYVGPTTQDYVHGCFYSCEKSGALSFGWSVLPWSDTSLTDADVTAAVNAIVNPS